MYRIVFSYCTILLLLLGTFVHSKPREADNLKYGNNAINPNTQIEHENQIVFSVGKSKLQPEEHEIIQEEPIILDLSTQVARYILYFLKKYCKNSDKIAYLENLLATKGIGSIFETIAEGNIGPNLKYFEIGSPHQNIESIKPKTNVLEQGHAINYNFDTVPTTKPETNRKEFIESVELTTQNIRFLKQYKTPKSPTEIQEHIENVQPNYDADYKFNVPKHSKTDYKYAKPEIMEPMYEYAARGDEYGITEYEYLLPDYDYSINPADNTNKKTKPPLEVVEHKMPIQNKNTYILPIHVDPKITKQKVSIIPKFDDQAQYMPTIQKDIHLKPKVSPVQQSSIPKWEWEPQTPDEQTYSINPNTNIINDWYTVPKEPTIQEHHELQPKIHENTYEFTMPKHQLEIETKPIDVKINQPIIKNTYELDKKEPGILDKLYKYIQPAHVEKNEDSYELPEYQHEIIPNANHEHPQVKEHILDFPSPEFEAKVEPHQVRFLNHEQPDLKEHSMPDTKQPDNNWINYQQEIEPQVYFIDHKQPNLKEPFDNQHTFDYSMPDTNQPDNLLSYQREMEPQVYFTDHKQPDLKEPFDNQHTFDYSMPDTKQPDNWLSLQEMEPKPRIYQEPPVHFIEDNQPDLEKPLVNQHTFDYSMPDTQQPDNWLSYQQEMEPKPQINQEPQVYFIDHNQPDLKEPLVNQHTFDYSMPDTQQPDNWLSYQQEMEPKPRNNQEPQVHFIDHNQPDLKEPFGNQHTFDYSMPDTQQPDNWFRYQKKMEPIPRNNQEPQVHFIDHNQPDLKEPLINQHTFDYSMPDTKQPDNWLSLQEMKPKLGVNQEPQVHFVDHKQPDVKEPLINQHTFDHSMPDTKQPDNWLSYQQEIKPKLGVNQGPQVHFIDHTQPDVKEPLVNQHTFDYPMPHYELNADVQQPALVKNDYKYQIPDFKVETVPHIEERGGPQVYFKNQEPHVYDYSMPKSEFKPSDTKQPEADSWFKYSIPEYQQEKTPIIEEKPQIHFDLKRPKIQYSNPNVHEVSVNVQVPKLVNTYEYSIPGYEQQNNIPYMNHQYHFDPNTKIDDQYSTAESPLSFEKRKYWLPNVKNNELPLSMQNEDNTFDINLKNYADNIFKKYADELQNLEDMKPYYKETVTGPTYIQFMKNIDKMKDVLNVWKYDGHFYEIPSIEYVTKTMTKLSNDTLQMMLPTDHTTSGIIFKPETTSQLYENTPDGSRRTFDGSEILEKHLKDPKSNQEFGTLDLILQNIILAYIDFGKLEKTADVKQVLLVLLHEIKSIMRKYKNLFNQLEWVDGEIENLTKDTNNMPPLPKEIHDSILFKGSWDLLKRINLNNDLDFDEGSKVFLTLLNLPVTAQSKGILKNLIHQLLKDIVDISDVHPEFKDVKFLLGEQKSLQPSALYDRLMALVASPKDFIERKVFSISGENKLPPVNRRTNDADAEVKTETEAEAEIETETEMPTTVTEEIVETTMQPTTPKRKVEKHRNIFREFLMDTDE